MRDSPYFFLKSKEKVGNNPVFFMNNSVIWFPEMIENYFNSIINKNVDIIAASISNQYRPHIQTFLFGALSNNGMIEIEQWLKKIKNWRLKRTTVSFGELATSKILKSRNVVESYPAYNTLQESGLKKIHQDFELIAPVIPNEVIQRLIRNRNLTLKGIPLNPSHNYWLEQIENGFPGIKVDLVRSNPSNLLDYEFVISTLLARGFDYFLINNLLNQNKSKSLVFKIRHFLRW